MLIKKQTCYTIDNRFKCTTLPVRNYGASGGHCFKRHNSEVFNTWENQGPTLTIMITNHRKWLASHDGNIRAGRLLNLGKLLTVTDNDEPFPGLIKGLYGQIGALVGYELADHKIEIFNVFHY